MKKNHYEKPNILESILARLKEEEIDLDGLKREDLSGLDEFHLQGAKVSLDLAEKANIYPGQKVLDVGCGIGGPCRMLADEFGAEVVGVDLTKEYIRTARALSELVGLNEKTTFLEANATSLPFEDESFDLVWTQHAQMNIKDKTGFYQEIKRVLRPGGLFVYYDVFTTSGQNIHFPVPWAEQPQDSFLIRHEELGAHFPTKQYRINYMEDHTPNAQRGLSKMVGKMEKGKAPQLGLNLLMQGTTQEKLRNLLKCLEESKVEVFAGIYEKEF
jgi:ubiquinone/menaquinone biosynthesis C-methylase UbiE